MTRYFVLFVVALTMCITAKATAARHVVNDFDEPFSYAYLSFEKQSAVKDGVLHVVGKDGKGGIGILQEMDLARFADHSPVIWVKAGPSNEANQIKFFFGSGESKRMFTCDISSLDGSRFTQVFPQDSLALSPAVADEPDQAFDPARIEVLQIQGDWSQNAVDVYVDRIELIPATTEMQRQRKVYAEKLIKKAEREAHEAEERRQQIEKLLAGAPHPEDGPNVTHVCTVAPDTIALTIESGRITPAKQVPYEAAAGDKIVAGKKGQGEKVLSWQDGKIVDAPKGRSVTRDTKGQGRFEEVGTLVVNHDLLAFDPQYHGTAITKETVDQVRAYAVVSRDDRAFAEPRHPEAVFVKSKPRGHAGTEMPVQYNIYLRLGSPLKNGASYTIEFVGINTRQSSITHKHDPRNVRTEALHVTQIGYRPADPFKRAYLSLWMGTGGQITYDDAGRFEIIDASSGQTQYEGSIVLGFAADREESILGGKNHTQTNVYYLDFHEFDQPGKYRIFVPGIGVSYPFEIAETVWARAYSISMHGFLSHRSGIELGPPFTSYERPRPMHPADGVKILELDVTYWNGEADSVDRSLRRLLGPDLNGSKVETHPDAWGGYMDAGDWDRRSQHLMATWVHLELLDLFPAYFEKHKLALPPNEAGDNLPDILNEALWNLDFYRRLQGDHGGVGGGVESTSHPVPGEASWQESLLLGTFAPDPETSLRYAACAATASRLLKKHDAKLAAQYALSAIKAWKWANENAENLIEAESQAEGSRGGTSPDNLRDSVQNMRALAAVALYAMSGAQEYHEAFRQSSLLILGGDLGKQVHSTFAYARLPHSRVDAKLKKAAIDWFEQAARDSMKYGRENAFSITCRVPMLPLMGYVGNYSVPEAAIGGILPRAHYLTGNEDYLGGAVAATQFSAGANPMNMTLTTGLGHEYPMHPLHVDSQHTGMEPPHGITVYGINDPATSASHLDWAHTWYLRRTMLPDSHKWPAAEFYIDLGNWPPTNEYTVHQTLGPTSFYWGYLAARPAK